MCKELAKKKQLLILLAIFIIISAFVFLITGRIYNNKIKQYHQNSLIKTAQQPKLEHDTEFALVKDILAVQNTQIEELQNTLITSMKSHKEQANSTLNTEEKISISKQDLAEPQHQKPSLANNNILTKLIITKLILIKNIARQEQDITKEKQELITLLNNYNYNATDLAILQNLTNPPGQTDLLNIITNLRQEIAEKLEKPNFFIHIVNKSFKDLLLIKKIKNFKPNSLDKQINLVTQYVKQQKYQNALVEIAKIEIAAKNLTLLHNSIAEIADFYQIIDNILVSVEDLNND
ncbi:MAG: hypothetical protein ACO2XZ_05625 [Rickettsiales bacterium]